MLLDFKNNNLSLSLIILIGAFLRFYNLGSLPIDGDNAFHALAAQGILEFGLPQMPNGEMYTRALPLLYLEAFSVNVFGWSEWGLRLPNALLGTLNIFLIYKFTYILARNNHIALLSALLFAISPWSVSMARMPRMYETLLTCSLLTWLFFFIWYFQKKKHYIFLLILASVLTISIHKLAILPLCCLIVPLLLEEKPSKNAIYSCCCYLSLLFFWHFYYSTNIITFFTS